MGLTFSYKSVIVDTTEYKIERYAVARTAFNREEGKRISRCPTAPAAVGAFCLYALSKNGKDRGRYALKCIFSVYKAL